MKGWFDAFRESGGPTFYSAFNRTSATVDVRIIIIIVVFITLYFAFLIIFPGVRKERFTTFTMVTVSLFTGAVILGCSLANSWLTGSVQVITIYRAFSDEHISGSLGVYVAFNNVNITLKGAADRNETEEIDFNERFSWDDATQLKREYRAALLKGLPFPLLTVVEYFSMNQGGFCWGQKYRQAGYYAKICLWCSFAIWFWMWILFCAIPRYGAYLMFLTGNLMLLANMVYYLNLPTSPLVIPFEQTSLVVNLGLSFWLVLITGIIAITTGMFICVWDWIHPNKFSHFMELDYGTPYDRHTIIEESHKSRFKNRPILHIPALRKLSTKSGSSRSNSESTTQNIPVGMGERLGIDNEVFEMDVPRTPWKHSRVFRCYGSSQLHKKAVSFQNINHPDATGGISERNRMSSYNETHRALRSGERYKKVLGKTGSNTSSDSSLNYFVDYEIYRMKGTSDEICTRCNSMSSSHSFIVPQITSPKQIENVAVEDSSDSDVDKPIP